MNLTDLRIRRLQVFCFPFWEIPDASLDENSEKSDPGPLSMKLR